VYCEFSGHGFEFGNIGQFGSALKLQSRQGIYRHITESGGENHAVGITKMKE
jgi:hypothetical protein